MNHYLKVGTRVFKIFCLLLSLSPSVPRRDRYDDRRDDRNGRRWTNRDAESDHRRRGRSADSPTDKEPVAADEPPVKKKKEEIDPILTRTGGAYIPPAKLRMMQQQITDKSRYERVCFIFTELIVLSSDRLCSDA